MILYSKSYWGIPLLLRLYGSVLPRVQVFAIAAAVIALTLSLNPGGPRPFLDRFTTSVQVDAAVSSTATAGGLADAPGAPDHPNPFDAPGPLPWLAARAVHPAALQAFTTAVAFSVLFRANHSYGRYWEACQQLHVMTAGLASAVSEALAWDADAAAPAARRARRWKARVAALEARAARSGVAGKRGEAAASSHAEALRKARRAAQSAAAEAEKALESAAAFRGRVLHCASLLHGLALQNLRIDWDLANLVRHEGLHSTPRAVPAAPLGACGGGGGHGASGPAAAAAAPAATAPADVAAGGGRDVVGTDRGRVWRACRSV